MQVRERIRERFYSGITQRATVGQIEELQERQCRQEGPEGVVQEARAVGEVQRVQAGDAVQRGEAGGGDVRAAHRQGLQARLSGDLLDHRVARVRRPRQVDALQASAAARRVSSS